MNPTVPSLSYYRRGAGLTQAALGELVGITKMSISNYESGRNDPTLKTLAAIAKALGVTLDALMSQRCLPDCRMGMRACPTARPVQPGSSDEL